MKKLFVIFVLLSFFFILNTSVSATIGKANHVSGLFEKIVEKITLATKFNNNDKANYYVYLADKRFSELLYVVGEKKIDLIEPTASRYTTYVDTASLYFINNKTVKEKTYLLNVYEEHRKSLDELIKQFPANSSYWLMMMNCINTLDQFSKEVKNI